MAAKEAPSTATAPAAKLMGRMEYLESLQTSLDQLDTHRQKLLAKSKESLQEIKQWRGEMKLVLDNKTGPELAPGWTQLGKPFALRGAFAAVVDKLPVPEAPKVGRPKAAADDDPENKSG